MQSFNELKVQGKLLVIFGSIILIGTLITGWTILSINNLDRLTNTLVESEFELSEALMARNLLKEMEVSELSYVISRDPEFIHEHEKFHAGLGVYLRNVQIRTESPTESAIFHEFEREFLDYGINIEKVEEAAHEEHWEEAIALGDSSAEIIEAMVVEIEEIIEIHEASVSLQAAKSTKQVQVSTIIGVVALLIFLMLALGAGVVVNQQITQPILVMMQAALDVENGVFDRRSVGQYTERSDEVGHLTRSFVHMAEEIEAHENILMARAAELRERLEHV